MSEDEVIDFRLYDFIPISFKCRNRGGAIILAKQNSEFACMTELSDLTSDIHCDIAAATCEKQKLSLSNSIQVT